MRAARALRKGFLYMIVGGVIDGLQAGVGLALSGITLITGTVAPAVGTGAGATLGCLVVGALGGVAGLLGAGVGAIPGAIGGCALGGAAGAAAGGAASSAIAITSGPVGTVAGYVFDLCLSFGGGALLITLLMYGKMFYPGSIFAGFFGEVVPFVNILPLWTAVAFRCAYKKVKEEDRLSQTQPKGGPLRIQSYEIEATI